MPCSQNASRNALVDVVVAVVAEERAVGEVAVELGAVGGLARPDPVEDLDRQAVGVVVGRSISGGTAETSTSFATRALPCRPT